eukprot:COSAG01_NODE_2904_length_6887_cov_2.857543_9_plen_98_part_00
MSTNADSSNERYPVWLRNIPTNISFAALKTYCMAFGELLSLETTDVSPAPLQCLVQRQLNVCAPGVFGRGNGYDMVLRRTPTSWISSLPSPVSVRSV